MVKATPKATPEAVPAKAGKTVAVKGAKNSPKKATPQKSGEKPQKTNKRANPWQKRRVLRKSQAAAMRAIKQAKPTGTDVRFLGGEDNCGP